LVKKCKKTIKYAFDKNYLIVIISNQSGISRNYFKKKDCDLLNLKINQSLKFKAIYRKPNPGLFFLSKKRNEY